MTMYVLTFTYTTQWESRTICINISYMHMAHLMQTKTGKNENHKKKTQNFMLNVAIPIETEKRQN